MANDKKCFIIMPISDQDGYDKGHFGRVYHHLLKPACIKAGFIPARADEEHKTNYIVIDIIRKIIEADIVICDLSAKNANVLYELGLRQAFNKKTVLVKDNKTVRVFDIQGLRTVDYDENLRVDEVENAISTISKAVTETYNSSADDINSLIQLLALQPAVIPTSVEISKESSLILELLTHITARLNEIEKKQSASYSNDFLPKYGNVFYLNTYEVQIGQTIYNHSDNDMPIGTLIDVQENCIVIRKKEEIITILKTDKIYSQLSPYPF